MFYRPSLFRQSHPVPEIKQKKNPTVIGLVLFAYGGDDGVRSKQRLHNSEVSEFTRINAALARRGSRRRRHGIAAQIPRKEKKPIKSGSYNYHLVELKAAKTHPVLYQINRTEYYCQIDLPLSDYPLYGKQLVASRS